MSCDFFLFLVPFVFIERTLRRSSLGILTSTACCVPWSRGDLHRPRLTAPANRAPIPTLHPVRSRSAFVVLFFWFFFRVNDIFSAYSSFIELFTAYLTETVPCDIFSHTAGKPWPIFVHSKHGGRHVCVPLSPFRETPPLYQWPWKVEGECNGYREREERHEKNTKKTPKKHQKDTKKTPKKHQKDTKKRKRHESVHFFLWKLPLTIFSQQVIVHLPEAYQVTQLETCDRYVSSFALIKQFRRIFPYQCHILNWKVNQAIQAIIFI